MTPLAGSGILATCLLRAAPGASDGDLRAAYDAAYGSEPFVRVMKADQVAVKDAGTAAQ